MPLVNHTKKSRILWRILILLCVFAILEVLTTFPYNVRVDFFGAVVDQENKPLEGVRVKMHARKWYGLLRTPFVYGMSFSKTVTTDKSGRFRWRTRGDVLSVDSLEKEGYQWESHADRSFDYSDPADFRPQRDPPAVFRLWRKDLSDPLVTDAKKFDIDPNGTIHKIDLLNGEIITSLTNKGHLRIWINRPANVIPEDKYDWSCEVKVVDGGLVEETNGHSSMYLAPSEGYVPTFKVEYKASDKKWDDSPDDRRFYLKLEDGRMYGRIALQIRLRYNEAVPARISIQHAFRAFSIKL